MIVQSLNQFSHVQFDIVQVIFFQIILEQLSILGIRECCRIRTAMSKSYPIIIGSNVYPQVDGTKWRFRIRYVRSKKHPSTIKVDGDYFGTYNDAKLSACLCECVLKGGGEVEWRIKCRMLSLSELVAYVELHYPLVENVKSFNEAVKFSTPTNDLFPMKKDSVDVQGTICLPIMSPCRLFDEICTTELPMHSLFMSRPGFTEVVDKIPMVQRTPLRIWQERRSFTASQRNGIAITHIAHLGEVILTLDNLGFPMLWRILRDNFKWGWDFGPVGPQGVCDDSYLLPGRDPHDVHLVEGQDKFLVRGRDRELLYGFLSKFGLTGQTMSRSLTEFHYGVDRLKQEPYIDIYEYPVYWVENRNKVFGRQAVK